MAHDDRQPPIPRGFVGLIDADGQRHVVRSTSVQMLSDGDPCRDTCVVVAAGRAMVIPRPLEEVVAQEWRG